MAVLEMRATDMHAVLGRLLDHVRMTDIRVAELSVWAEGGGYAIRLSLDTADSEGVSRLARRVGGIVGVTELETAEGGASSAAASAPGLAAAA